MTDKAAIRSKEIVVTREFDAPRERVWKAWTDPDLVQRWYGPEGFSSPSIKIDLRVGGKYIWAMRGPAGSPMDRVMYVSGVYQEIVTNARLVVVEYMSDEHGTKVAVPGRGDPESADMMYTVRFEDAGEGKTRLSITYPAPETEEQYQALLKSGMVEGWSSSLNKLAQALAG